jgi:hypothetical protein
MNSEDTMSKTRKSKSKGATAPRTGSEYNAQVHAAYRLIARHVYGGHGLGAFAYAAFGYINSTYFAAALPEPLILWDITAFGKCLGQARSPRHGPPIIKLRPSTVAPSPTAPKPPWDVDPSMLGYCYAYQVLLHELVHVAVNYLRGGLEAHPEFSPKWTSHNNPVWVEEINRLAALMGHGPRGHYDMKRYRRVPTGQLNERGRPITKVKFSGDGPLDPERFPFNLPGADTFRRRKKLPFTWDNPCCTKLHTTTCALALVITCALALGTTCALALGATCALYWELFCASSSRFSQSNLLYAAEYNSRNHFRTTGKISPQLPFSTCKFYNYELDLTFNPGGPPCPPEYLRPTN